MFIRAHAAAIEPALELADAQPVFGLGLLDVMVRWVDGPNFASANPQRRNSASARTAASTFDAAATWTACSSSRALALLVECSACLRSSTIFRRAESRKAGTTSFRIYRSPWRQFCTPAP